jgi:ribosomal protein S6--L-glutamate ligase
MATRLPEAGIPSPPTIVLSGLSELHRLEGPVVVKSQLSRRADLVACVATPQALAALRENWASEPVVVQPWIPNSGWDLKLWVVGTKVYAAHRPTPLELPVASAAAGSTPIATVLLSPDEVPVQALAMTLAVGESFGLDIYGVDIITGPQGPLVVDVNPFPGARGIPGVARAIVDFALARAGQTVGTLL